MAIISRCLANGTLPLPLIEALAKEGGGLTGWYIAFLACYALGLLFFFIMFIFLMMLFTFIFFGVAAFFGGDAMGSVVTSGMCASGGAGTDKKQDPKEDEADKEAAEEAAAPEE